MTLTEAEDGTLAVEGAERTAALALVPLRGDVRFHDVVFGYTPEKKVS